MEAILELDYQLFEWINSGWSNGFMDAIMPLWREKSSWIPLYLLAVIILIWKYRKKTIYFFLALALCVGLADQISSELIKKSVQRLRPCRTATIEAEANVLIHCGGGYSFPSSHATNHFAVAVFLFLTWGKIWKRWKYLLLFWAASISIGQVYVGVHFPIDILFGSILGTTLGFLFAKLYQKFTAYRISGFYI